MKDLKLSRCKRFVAVFIWALFFSSMGLFFNCVNAPDVFASGGAFPFTKHGGGTVDGFDFAGINRGINPDHGGVYSADAGAGIYASGECTHCHEPHASFGGSEACPDGGGSCSDDASGGPNDYLLLRDNDNGVCWYCHEYMSLGFPPKPIGYGYWGFYQGKGNFEGSSHGTDAGFRWPGTGVAGEPWARTYARPVADANKCINCHTAHGIAEATGSEYDTGAVPTAPTNRHLAANNADVSTDNVIPRQLIAWEEGLCLTCHDSTPAANIDAELAKTSYHPIADTALAGRHTPDEHLSAAIGWNSVASNTRHAECVDCHNPHVAKSILGSANQGSDPNRTSMTKGERSAEMIRIRGPLLGGWGVKPTGMDGTWGGGETGWPTPAVDTLPGAGWPNPTDGNVTAFTKITFSADDTTTPDMYEAYLCLKCHSYYAWGADGFQSVTTGSGTYEQTDVSRDFNPKNYGYHPVFNHGQNRPGAANANFDNAFVSARGMYSDSYITCTDCHASDNESAPRGPHGSANVFILRSNQYGTATAVLCHNCHNMQTYGNGGNGGTTFGTDTFSHVDHPPDDGNRVVDGTFPSAPMAPIYCMLCHGGSRFGGIHGSNEGPGSVGGTTNRGYRLLNGSQWGGWTYTAGGPVCEFGVNTGYTSFGSCNNSAGSSQENYNYTYAPTHYNP